MKTRLYKKTLAIVLSTAMVAGGSITAFATENTDANGATGTGTSFDHVSKEITTVTLPTTSSVQNIFNYYVDPERLIQDAKSLPDGTTTVTPNDNGVYFPHAAVSGTAVYAKGGEDKDYTITGVDLSVNATYTYKAERTEPDAKAAGWYDEDDEAVTGTITVKDGDNNVTLEPNDTITVSGAVDASFSSTSMEVPFNGLNSVDVDVSVTASIAENAKNIKFVEDAAALAASEEPALLLNMTIGDGTSAGTETKAITADGASAKAKIEGIPENFKVTTESGKYVYKVRTNTDTSNGGTALDDWNSVSLKLTGKTNVAEVPEGAGAMVAPQITLAWTIAKHVDQAQVNQAAATSFKTTHADVVALTTDDVEGTEEELEKIEAAITAFEALDDAVKTILAEDSITAEFLSGLKDASEEAAAPQYTEETATGNWSGSTLWIGPDGADGFTNDTIIVEISEDDSTYSELASFSYSQGGWVGVTWGTIDGAVSDTSTYYIRITDGTTRYTYSAQ